MSWIFSCRHGHQWSVTQDEAASAARAAVCPSCGQAGELTSPRSTSLLREVVDALPPPPTALPPRPPAAAVEPVRDGRRNGPARPEYPPVEGYEILREVGRGGMGLVYQARQLSLNRIVALKMVLAGAHAGVEELLRFRTEAEAAARLKHANIVQIHEVGQAGGQPFFSLEYVEGGNLAQKLGGTPLPPRDAAELVETLARAVHYAHECGVIHRDLKPANVLLTAGGVPKITDFGLAKAVEHEPASAERATEAESPSGAPRSALGALTQTGAVLGTPSYMAPEQAQGRSRDIGPATDVYALGAILYEALTGRPPFRAATPLETLQQVVSEEPVPLSRLQRKLKGDLETICLKCLQKEPAKRYASTAALADDLRRFLNGEPILARRTGTAERLWRWCRRNPRVASLLSALVVVFLAGFAGVTLQWQRAEREWRRAEQQRDEADKNYRLARQVVNDYFASLGNDPWLDHHRAFPLRQDLLETALKHFQDLRQKQDDADLQVHLARACYCLGQIRTFGDRYAEAATLYQDAIVIQEHLVREHAGVVRYQRDLARSYTRLGLTKGQMNQLAAARAAQQRGFAICERLYRTHPADPELRLDMASSYAAVGWLHHLSGEFAEGLRWLDRARDLLEKLVQDQPDELAYHAALSGTLNNIGLSLHSSGQAEKALEVFQAAIKRQRPVFTQAQHAAKYQALISTMHFNMAKYALLPLNRPVEAAAAALQGGELSPEDSYNLWRVARVLAEASKMVAADGSSPELDLSRHYADQAVATLQRAARWGSVDAGTFAQVEFEPLMSRHDFQELRARYTQHTAKAAKK